MSATGEALFQNLLTLIILLSLFIIVYLKMTNKTIRDLILDLKEINAPTELEGGIP